MTITFEKAKRERVKLRMGLWGLNGSGKTLAALKVAAALPDGGPVYGIDTEHGRMKLYAHLFDFEHAAVPREPGGGVLPDTVRDYVRVAVAAGAGTVVLDSASHEWFGCLNLADRFGDWKTVTPIHNDFFDELTNLPCHVIVTMRSKINYEVTVGENNKQTITQLGPGPVQGKGVEYEFDVLGQIDRDTHVVTFANRCDALVGKSLMIDDAIPLLLPWLEAGDPDPAMVRADPERIALLRELKLAEGLTAEQVDDVLDRRALQSGGALTAGWVDEKIAEAEAKAQAKAEARERNRQAIEEGKQKADTEPPAS